MWSVIQINYFRPSLIISMFYCVLCLKAQTMFAMMKTGKMERFMKDLEILGLLVACVSFVVKNKFC